MTDIKQFCKGKRAVLPFSQRSIGQLCYCSLSLAWLSQRNCRRPSLKKALISSSTRRLGIAPCTWPPALTKSPCSHSTTRTTGANPRKFFKRRHRSWRICWAKYNLRALGSVISTQISKQTGNRRAKVTPCASHKMCHRDFAITPPYNGILSCFFQGLVSFLPRNAAKARDIRIRVLRGWITSSIKPRSAATNGLANRVS